MIASGSNTLAAGVSPGPSTVGWTYGAKLSRVGAPSFARSWGSSFQGLGPISFSFLAPIRVVVRTSRESNPKG